MSLLKSNSVQIGQSATATQNFTLSVPASPDGTIKLARGNSGATTADVLTVDASGNVTTTLAGGSVKFSQLSTSATEADNVASRTAKAWVNFDGTLAAASMIREEFNISSITDNGSGDYTLNFRSSLEDINYVVSGSCSSISAFNVVKIFQNASGAVVSPTTSAARIVTGNGTTNQDSESICIGVLR